MEQTEGCTYEYLPWRNVTKDTMAFFKCSTRVDKDGAPDAIAFPYPNGAKKVRLLAEKKFYTQGPSSEPALFGQDKFQAGGKTITITEGELDALSVWQILQCPTVSVRSSSSARKDCGASYDYLNSFERILLCLDNDEPGRKAAREIASLFDFNKVYEVNLSRHKDANEYLTSGHEVDLAQAWHNAKRYLPEGIISDFASFDQIIDEDRDVPSVPYPFPELQEMTYGIRPGEYNLFTAPEGIGKTEIMRAIEFHLLKRTDANIAVLHLEENKSRLLKGIAGYELGVPCHLRESGANELEIKRALHRAVGRPDRLHVYSHFGSDDPDILLSTIRFLVTACGCKYVFLDHITMAVTGLEMDDERRTLDYLSTCLSAMVHDLVFTLFVVSHVNDEGKTRGSRNVSKVADLWVHLSRNLLADSDIERNITTLTVQKNRFSGKTGPGGKLQFDPMTFKITPVVKEIILPTE